MAKEYLVALFDRSRRIKVNGQYMGRTNTLIELEPGRYHVTLGPPQNFNPEHHSINLQNTSALKPRVVRFEPDQSEQDEE